MSLRALAALAAIDPEAPFVFAPSGRDWRWLSASVALERVGALAASLAALPAGARVVYQDSRSPDALLLDLAITGSGLTACPRRDAALSLSGDARVVWAESESAPPAVAGRGEVLVLERPFRFATRGPEHAVGQAAAGRIAAGRVRVEGVGEIALERVTRVARSLADPSLARERRPSTVLSLPFGESLGRFHLAWGFAMGVAWVAAPGESPAAVERWARATVQAGPLAALDAERSAWNAGRPRWRRLTVWLHGAEDPPREGARDYWRERGVTLVAAPAFS